MDFIEFQKIPRLSRGMVITEKLDGMNMVIAISDDSSILKVGSRYGWIDSEHGVKDLRPMFRFAMENRSELIAKLGPGRHYGEWWGLGIGRGYGLKEKRFSLFNTARWGLAESRPSCCDVVPVLYEGIFDTSVVDTWLLTLKQKGSYAAPGFMQPEGVVVFHTAGNYLFKKTLDKNDFPKGL